MMSALDRRSGDGPTSNRERGGALRTDLRPGRPRPKATRLDAARVPSVLSYWIWPSPDPRRRRNRPIMNALRQSRPRKLRTTGRRSRCESGVLAAWACVPAPLCSPYVWPRAPPPRCQRDQARLGPDASADPEHSAQLERGCARQSLFPRRLKPRYYDCARAQNPSEIMCVKLATQGRPPCK
jgi:hypothetical protein